MFPSLLHVSSDITALAPSLPNLPSTQLWFKLCFPHPSIAHLQSGTGAGPQDKLYTYNTFNSKYKQTASVWHTFFLFSCMIHCGCTAHFLSGDSDPSISNQPGKNAQRVNYTSILSICNPWKCDAYSTLSLSLSPTTAYFLSGPPGKSAYIHNRTTLSILWMIAITFLFMNTCGVPSVIQVLQVRSFTNHYTLTV